jgi:hypothetical protein
LNAPEIIELDLVSGAIVLVPGPEDYAALPPEKASPVTCQQKIESGTDDDTDNPVADPGATINNNNQGFIDRSDAISLKIFSNANSGATLFTYGVQPTTLNADGHLTGVLRLQDIYLTVQCEKTYISFNGLEGAKANAITYATDGICSSNNTPKTMKACATWLQLHNEAQHIYEVNEATKAKRDVVFKIGVGNLARYTTGTYNATIWFSLIPQV